MKQTSNRLRTVLGITLFITGILCCIKAFSGHTTAYSAAAVCFFAVPAIIVRRETKK